MCMCMCLVLDLTSSWSSNSHHFDSSAAIMHYQLYLCVCIPLAVRVCRTKSRLWDLGCTQVALRISQFAVCFYIIDV